MPTLLRTDAEAPMSYGKPEGLPGHAKHDTRAAFPCRCGGSMNGRRFAKKAAKKWLRLRWKDMGEFAPNKLRYMPHFC